MSLASTGCPKKNCDKENSGQSPHAGPGLANFVLWKSTILSSLLVIAGDGTIYATSSSKITAINPDDGTAEWELPLNAMSGCPAIGSDGTNLWAGFTTEDIAKPALHAVNPDGTLKWTCGFASLHYSPESGVNIAPDGTIAFSSWYTYAFSATGVKKWTNSRTYVYSTPAFDSNGNIYYSSPYPYCVDSSGTTKWYIRLDSLDTYVSLIFIRPILFNNVLHVIYGRSPDGYYGDYEINVAKIDLSGNIVSKKYLFTIPYGGGLYFHSFCMDSDGNIYIWSQRNVSAFTNSGVKLWDSGYVDFAYIGYIGYVTDTRDQFMVVGSGDYLYGGNRVGEVFAIDKNTGIVRWRLKISTSDIIGISIGPDNCLYVVCATGTFKIGSSGIDIVETNLSEYLTDASTGKTITPLLGGV